MIDYRSPKYLSVPIIVQNQELPIIRFPTRPLFVRVQNGTRAMPTQTPKRDSQDTSLNLSQTNEKMLSISSEISHMSTFYQSYDQKENQENKKEKLQPAPQSQSKEEIKGFDWQSFRQNAQQLKQQCKENGAVLKKTNSFHLNGKFNRNQKNQRANKPIISEVLTPPNRQITFDQVTISRQLHKNESGLPTRKSPQCASPETRRKSNGFREKTDFEYSYRKDNQNTSFFQSVDSKDSKDSCELQKKRSQSLNNQSQTLKLMIDKAIKNTKNFDVFIQNLLQ